jgi:hypothetical protein
VRSAATNRCTTPLKTQHQQPRVVGGTAAVQLDEAATVAFATAAAAL